MIIKGNNMYLKIYSSGKTERWTELREDVEEQYPIVIEPIIPIMPK